MSDDCCGSDKSPTIDSSHYTIGLLGNPNCGKSTLFNTLTGSRQKIGNWPGVTVDRKIGQFEYNDIPFNVVDLPGVYSLDNSARSLDEKVTRDYILSSEPDLIVNVLNASNLERNLYLSAQLLEMHVPMIIALNMMDLADAHDIEIDQQALAEQFGCPVVAITAHKNIGLEDLMQSMLQASQKHAPPTQILSYPDSINQAINSLLTALPDQSELQTINPRWIAVHLLDGSTDMDIFKQLDQSVLDQAQQLRQKIEMDFDEDMDILLADSRYGFARKVTDSVVSRPEHVRFSMSDRIDNIVLNRFLGIPIFLGVIYLMFLFTINLGGAFIEFFDLAAGAIFIDGFSFLLESIGTPDWLRVILSNGLGGGIQVVATFIPIIGFLYLFLSFVESSGYMMRAAFVVDRLMRSLGLPGKAFVPLIVGFGCNVPSIMATRTLEVHRERIITVLMAPFMSCGARLSVYALFAAAFFPEGGQNIVFILYIVGILFAIFTAFIIKSTLLPGEASHFLMELPTYHMPKPRDVLIRTWSRLKSFLMDAGKVIILMVLVINFLNSLGTDGSFGNEDQKNSVLSAISRGITPVFAPMGIEEDNWPATVGIFAGVLAKEVVVGTLDAIYSQLDQPVSTQQVAEFSLTQSLSVAVESVPRNLLAVLDNLTDPLGFNVLENTTDQQAAATEQNVDTATFGAMVKRFDGQVGAFAYLLFILLYAPCVAATAAIYKQAGARWMWFALAWSTGMAWSAATLFYQTARFNQHPVSSMAWIIGIIAMISIVLLYMRREGKIINKLSEISA